MRVMYFAYFNEVGIFVISATEFFQAFKSLSKKIC